MTDKSSEARYRLRESAKLPARFQEYQLMPETIRKSVRARPSAPAEHGEPSKVLPTDVPPEEESVDDVMDEDYEPGYAAPVAVQPPSYERPRSSELTRMLRLNLKSLKNMLVYPKGRGFVFAEFFYSAIDRQIFLEENEFLQMVHESFPNLKNRRLRPAEWREVRRLVGKPRRFSAVFLEEERRALNYKRRKIRQIYGGACVQLPADHDLPKRLPRQFAVGARVFARIRQPQDGIYVGTVDAVLSDGYRVVFEKQEMIPPMIVPDYEVMSDEPAELIAIGYFLEMNQANGRLTHPVNPLLAKPPAFVVDPRQSRVVSMVAGPDQTPQFAFQQRAAPAKRFQEAVSLPREDKVGNFPLRLLVIMVKLFKVLEHKQLLVTNMRLMNDRAEKMQMVADHYPTTFQERYAEILNELESVNRLLHSYLSGIEEYNDLLVTNLSEPRPADRPDQLRKHSQAHANQLVKHCTQTVSVRNKQMLGLVTKLIAVMIQTRTLGSPRQPNPNYELNVLAESLNQLRASLHPSNVSYFQDCVEVHMKQIFQMTNKCKSA